MAHRVAFGAFAHAGQSCISVQRLLVNEQVKESFMAAFVAAARAMKVGDPFRHDTEVGPMISIDAVQRARGVIKDALRAGANVVYGGNTYNMFTMNPTILDRTTPEMAVNAEEVFAPIVTVATYQNFEEALALVNQSRYGLQAGIYTADANQIELAYQTLDVGSVVINDIPGYRSDLLPYGGVKASGLGREGVMAGLAEYSYTKTLVQKTLG
jgi:acyl-CoA reductase-like NAD-dependent aldehyde dehydrogenase